MNNKKKYTVLFSKNDYLCTNTLFTNKTRFIKSDSRKMKHLQIRMHSAAVVSVRGVDVLIPSKRAPDMWK